MFSKFFIPLNWLPSNPPNDELLLSHKWFSAAFKSLINFNSAGSKRLSHLLSTTPSSPIIDSFPIF